MQSETSGDFYTPKQAAAILKIHLNTMYRLAKMPAHKGGPPKRKLSPRIIRFPKQKFLVWAGINGE